MSPRALDAEQFLWILALCLCASATALFVDESVFKIGGLKFKYRDSYWIWLLSSLILVACAQACITYISAAAAGSGIPQMKAIMAGVKLPGMLSKKTLLAKVLGMICMLSSGMSLGKEGPFVHIAGCIARSLPYKSLKTNAVMDHQFLTAAVAVGVTCTFGAPIGGVLFAIEVSSTSFSVNNLWKSFFASTITVLCFKSVGKLSQAAIFTVDGSYFYSGITNIGINHEQPFFVVLGLLCGIGGSYYIQFQRWVNVTKKANGSRWWVKQNFVYSLGMTFILTNIMYWTRLMQWNDKAVIKAMVDIDQNIAKLGPDAAKTDMLLKNQFQLNWAVMDNINMWSLYEGYNIMFFIMKFMFTAFTLSCAIPGGIFTPTFCMGAVLGQIYVGFLISFLGFFQAEDWIQFRGVYSLLGAAAFCGSVTRTVSVAMIVLELNGHLSHACPIMVCVLSSYTMSEYIKPQSFFEMLSEFSGLDAKIAANGKIIVKDILKSNDEYCDMKYLTLNDCLEEELLKVVIENSDNNNDKRLKFIPVVDNSTNMNIMYIVKTSDLFAYCSIVYGSLDGKSINETRSIKQVGSGQDRISTRQIIESVKHIAPHIIFQESPISYLADGQAEAFYHGQGEEHVCNYGIMMFYIVKAFEFEEVLHGDDVTVQSNINGSQVGQNYTLQKYGCQLVGTIPVSDALGVDGVLKKYEASKAAKIAAKKSGVEATTEPLLQAQNQGQLQELQNLNANKGYASQHPENLRVDSPTHQKASIANPVQSTLRVNGGDIDANKKSRDRDEKLKKLEDDLQNLMSQSIKTKMKKDTKGDGFQKQE